MRCVVVGGGIGGLAAAVALACSGHEVVVLERSGSFTELGAGIQLAPNGVHALDRLGLGDQVRSSAVHIDELRFMDGLSGEHVVSMPLTAAYRRRFDNPYVVVHRGELYGLLLDRARELGGIRLRAGSTVTGYEQDAAVGAALLADGGRVEADVVIGADGVRSRVREQLVGDGAPVISGITVHRALVPVERVPVDLRRNVVTWWAGPGCHFVHYPVAGGRFLNMAASTADGATEAVAGAPVDAAATAAVFAVLGEMPRRLLALGTQWRTWTLLDRDPVDLWTDGRVALLGDAAHPMLHYAAQGACQALEDAVVLGELFDGPPGGPPVRDRVADRLVAYNDLRRARTARIQRLSRDSIRLWHATGEGATARNTALAAMSTEDLHRYVAWMHGGPTAATTGAR